MPRRCSCFGCRGNYDGTTYVKVISFPKDPEERERWMLAMPNEPRCPATKPCEGTDENLRARPKFVRTPTQATGILVGRPID